MVYSVNQLILSRKSNSAQSGFTLFELIVAIAIIGILITAGFSSYTNSQRVARDGRRKTDLETMRQALELYRSQNGSYAPATTGSTETGANALKPLLTSPVPYISNNNFPKDPQTTQNNYYYYERNTSNTGQYRLCALLEAPQSADPSCPPTTAGYSGTPNCRTVGGSIACNYGLSQP